MREVARRLDVSAMMVSRALNNKPGITAEKREWVLEEANRMGYKIHPHVRSFMAARRKQQSERGRVPIALLNFWNPATAITGTPAYRDMQNGCIQRAGELGYRVDVFCPRASGMTMARLDKILQSRGICGVLILPLPSSNGHVRLDWSRYTAIAMGFTLRYPDIHRVTCNPALAMQTIIHHLKHFSYKRIGLITTESAERRLNSHNTGSFLSWQNKSTGKILLPICRVRPNQKNVLRQWLRRHRPDAVILQASWMCKWIQEAGFSIPENFGVAVLDLYEEDPQKYGVDSAGTRLGNDLVGYKAAEMLISQLERHEQGIPARPTVLMVPPLWHEGRTLC